MLLYDPKKDPSVVLVDPARTYSALAVFRDHLADLMPELDNLWYEAKETRSRISAAIKEWKKKIPVGFLGNDKYYSKKESGQPMQEAAPPVRYVKDAGWKHTRAYEDWDDYDDAYSTVRRHSHSYLVREAHTMFYRHARLDHVTITRYSETKFETSSRLKEHPKKPEIILAVIYGLDEDIRLAKMAVASYPVKQGAALHIAHMEDGTYLHELRGHRDNMAEHVEYLKRVEAELPEVFAELERMISEFQGRTQLANGKPLPVEKLPEPVVNPTAKYPPEWMIWAVMGVIIFAIVYFGFLKK